MNYAVRLDFPPTVNHYWKRHGHTIYLSNAGRSYKSESKAAVALTLGDIVPSTARIGVQIELAAPNKTRDTDIDNRIKSILDSLSGVLFVDDGQIDELIIKRLPIAPPGYADVIVSEL